MTSRLEKLIPYFPSFRSGDVQNTLTHMAEFIENESKKIYADEKVGDYFRSQIFASTLFMMQRLLLFIYAPGVGKSCVQIASMMRMYSSSDFYKKTLIATTSALTETMKYQALCKCTTGLLKKNGEPNEIYKTKMKIMSHRDLTNRLVNKTFEELNETFNDTIIMIDEISKIILSDFSSSHRDEESFTYSVNDDLKRLNALTTIDKNGKFMDVEEIINSDFLIRNEKKYIQLWRLTHACPTVRFMGLSGTPITNHPIELFILGNLFLPIKEQYNIQEISLNIFDDIIGKLTKLNGFISYLEPSASTATAVYQGEILPYKHVIPKLGTFESKLKLYFSEMYHIQAETLFPLGTRVSAKNLFYQIQCYVNQEGKYGAGSYEEEKTYVDEDEEEEEEVDVKIEEDDIKNLNNNLVRMECASMFSEIMAIEKRAFDDSNGEGGGCGFIYNKMTKTVNEPLKKIAELFGFRVISKEDLELEKSAKSKNYCGIDDLTVKGIPSGKKLTRPSIIFMDGDMKDKRLREKITQIISSKENVRGRRIQIVMTSKVSEMGYNFGNQERYWKLSPEWSGSVDKQVLYRVLRTGGHDYWIKWMEEHGRNSKPTVAAYYFTPYCKYHYITEETSKHISNKKNILTRDIVNKDGVDYCRINSKSVAYIIGFCKSKTFNDLEIDGKKVLLTELFTFTKENECPFDYFRNKLEELGLLESSDFTKELIFGDENYDVIYCYCGIVYSISSVDAVNITKNEKLVFIYKNVTFNFKELFIPCINDNKLLAKLKFKVVCFDKEGNVSVAECRTTVVSPAYAQYMVMERKNIIAKKFIRPTKQIAVDCKSNKERNTLDPIYDNTDACDYELCEYTCSSDLFPEKSKDAFIYENDEVFYDNKETLFSKEDIDRCKNRIYGLLQENNTITFTELYGKLIDSNEFRKRIITKSIIDMLGTKCSFLDPFGFQCFVSANNDCLFLRRDKNQLKTETKWVEDISCISGIDSIQDFGLGKIVKDDKIFEELDNMVPKNGTEFTDKERANILMKVSSLSLTSSMARLLEHCVLRVLKYKDELKKLKGTGTKPSFSCYAARIILDAFKLYIIRIEKDDNDVFINTFPYTKTAGSTQNAVKRKEDPKDFRILKFPYTEWKNPEAKDVTAYKGKIKEYITSELERKLKITIVNDEDEVTEVISPYYVVYEDNGDYKFSRITKMKTGTKWSSRSFKSMNADPQQQELDDAIQYFYDNLYFAKYINDAKSLLKEGAKLPASSNVKKVIEEYMTLDKKKKADKIKLFIRICDLLSLIHRTTDEIVRT